MKAGREWLMRSHGEENAVRVVQSYRTLFGMAEAYSVLKDLTLYCQLGQSSFVSGDPYHTAFNEGARDVLLHILEIAGIDPAELLTSKGTLQ